MIQIYLKDEQSGNEMDQSLLVTDYYPKGTIISILDSLKAVRRFQLIRWEVFHSSMEEDGDQFSPFNGKADSAPYAVVREITE